MAAEARTSLSFGTTMSPNEAKMRAPSQSIQPPSDRLFGHGGNEAGFADQIPPDSQQPDRAVDAHHADDVVVAVNVYEVETALWCPPTRFYFAS